VNLASGAQAPVSFYLLFAFWSRAEKPFACSGVTWAAAAEILARFFVFSVIFDFQF
jgi:hypothetical protein